MSSATGAPLVATLRRLLHPPAAHGLEKCELCAAALPDPHAHIVDTLTRRLLCACATCGTPDDGPELQQGAGSAARRYRAVPRRYVHSVSMTLSEAEWQSLGIPVGLAFFFFNSGQGRTVACYPGPAGPTESLLPLDAWSALAVARPWIGTIAPDVEALLVRQAGDGHRCFIVPIDACYELVGRIRAHWSGLGGGDRVLTEIEDFFAALVAQSRPETEGP